MKRNKFKTLAVSGLVVAATALTSISAMAVDVNVNSPSAKVQQKVVLEKTEAVVHRGDPRNGEAGFQGTGFDVHPEPGE